MQRFRCDKVQSDEINKESKEILNRIAFFKDEIYTGISDLDTVEKI